MSRSLVLAVLVLSGCDSATLPARDRAPSATDSGVALTNDGGAAAETDGASAAIDAGAAVTVDAPSTRPPRERPEGWRVVGYFTAWGVYGRDFHVDEIPAELLTHVNYAFANVSESGECVLGDAYADVDRAYPGDTWDEGVLRGSFRQLQRLREAHPHLRTLISVGGWTWSGRFSDVALTAASRARFATSCADFMERYGFDGIDVDWEYPVSGGLETNTTRPEDRANYTLLLAAMRDELDRRGAIAGRSYLLTIAAPAGPTTIANLELEPVAEIVDWVNLMAYDFHGGWDGRTGHDAPLHASLGDPTPALTVESAVDAYLAGGVPGDAIVLGVPFYGRGFSGVAPGPSGTGLFQPSTGLPMGTWEAGVFDWHDLRAHYVGVMPGFRDEAAGVPFLYDAASGVWISYDDVASLEAKVAFARSRGLGGAMLWELSSDDGEHSLLRAIQ